MATPVVAFILSGFLPALLLLLTNRFALSWTLWIIFAIVLASLQAGKYHFLQSPLFLTDLFPATVRTMLGVLPGLSSIIIALIVILTFAVISGFAFATIRIGRSSSRAHFATRLLLAALFTTAPIAILSLDQTAYAKVLQSIKLDYSDFSRSYLMSRVGFWGALWHDVRYLAGQYRPSGYNKESALALRQKYGAPVIAARPKTSVIILLIESFWDPLQYSELKISPDPIPFFRSLQQRHRHGNIKVPMYGGGTALTEFEILTGLPTSHLRGYPYVNLRKKIPTLATHFAKMGHATAFVHGYKNWFYARDRAVPLMGFDRFLYNDNIYAHFQGIEIDDSRYIEDAYFMRYLLLQTSDAPFFIFASSYATHGPFINENESKTFQISTALPVEAREALHANLLLLAKADDALRRLVNFIERSKQPVALFMFGDHVPNQAYIHLDLRKYDDEKPFWLPYVLVMKAGSKAGHKEINLQTTAVGNFILNETGQRSAPQFRAASRWAETAVLGRENSELEKSMVVYDLLFGEQIIDQP